MRQPTDAVARARRGLAAIAVLLPLAAGIGAHAATDSPGRIERIDLKGDGSATKVFIMLSRPLPFAVHVLDGDAARKTARRLVIDFDDATLAPDAAAPLKVGNGLVQAIRTGQFKASTARIVLDLANDATHAVDAYETPPHVTIAIAR